MRSFITSAGSVMLQHKSGGSVYLHLAEWGRELCTLQRRPTRSLVLVFILHNGLHGALHYHPAILHKFMFLARWLRPVVCPQREPDA